MTTKARDEKWSEWIDNDSGEIPKNLVGEIVSVKYRDGVINNGVHAGQSIDAGGSCPERNAFDWSIDGVGRDIIAYRYKIKEPESGIAEPDEEECLQLAYERMGDESSPTSVKQLRYQDAKGEDWIDEFSRTATVDEFRGAMRFTIGKYNRRAGKKDELIKEIEKMRDYCERWLEYERKVGQ